MQMKRKKTAEQPKHTPAPRKAAQTGRLLRLWPLAAVLAAAAAAFLLAWLADHMAAGLLLH